MRELVGGKNTIGRTAAVLKKPHKATFNLFYCQYYENKLSKIFVFQRKLNKKSVTLTLQFVSVIIIKCALFSKFHA